MTGGTDELTFGRASRIHRVLRGENFANVLRTVCEQLRVALNGRISTGARIAVTAANCGIEAFVELLSGIVDAVREFGGQPFLLPPSAAMARSDRHVLPNSLSTLERGPLVILFRVRAADQRRSIFVLLVALTPVLQHRESVPHVVELGSIQHILRQRLQFFLYLLLGALDPVRREGVRRKYLPDGSWFPLLHGFYPLKEVQEGDRILAGLVHVVESEIIRLALHASGRF